MCTVTALHICTPTALSQSNSQAYSMQERISHTESAEAVPTPTGLTGSDMPGGLVMCCNFAQAVHCNAAALRCMMSPHDALP